MKITKDLTLKIWIFSIKYLRNKLSYFYHLQRRYWEFQLAEGVVLSFPKCGRTWMKEIILETLPKKTYYVNKILLCESIFSKTFWEVFFNKKKYIGFTHDPRFAILNINKTVLLIRNPFDATISLYYHQRYKSRLKVEEDIDKFFLEKLSDILIFYKEFIPFFLKKGRLIKYEDNIQEPYQSFSKTIKLLNCFFKTEKLKNVIETNNFENLQKKEIQRIIKKKKLNPEEISINQLKYREGKINSYKKELNDKTIEQAKAIAKRIFLDGNVEKDLIRLLNEYKIF